MEPPEMINAGELVLKRWEPEWAAELSTAVRESLPELKPWLPWATDAYGLAESSDYIGRSVDDWAKGAEFNYAIFTTVGELIGSIGLMTRMGPGILEIGYWIRTPYSGRGHMTAAVTVLTRVAFTLPGIERVAIRHDAANAGSARVAEKAGFAEVSREPGDTGRTDVIREHQPV
ncbi:GNAT family N-acetyltransferase [Actinoplanes utahensis]|uniref:GCN5 family acetyltransferase n=1 Tax=Actinoplanes utahensis TaxID=1869 RepID=A0A0A6USD0_ACTUT|nr:GNAT family N-acetyltransferase [Actinoplanes utahensis]KHD77354.1 GCN5 family acetyltransferase [Actinoplanes utahensis]GIF32902.1 N-acetyltransferase [Actinoplanes utahensis]